jgi:F0F1-type ATP synthase membrane subunit a
MLSGHGLLKILIGFSFVALRGGDGWFHFGVLPWIIVTIVLVLEIAIAFLQAYVFIILTAIYINDAINVH